MNPEQIRLGEDARREKNWKRWGPYLAERQWGTVREDYSATGECWKYFPHDHARSRAYRWGEDGLLGICDRECRLCFALALWNGQRPDSQRAPLRPLQRGRQSWRRRERVLFLPRLLAHALLHESAVQISAAANFPTRNWWRKTASAHGATRNTNCSTPASSTRAVISMSSSSMRRPRRRTS